MRDGRSSGDGAVFESLYPGLRRFAGVVRTSSMDPDDLVQEALARTLAARSLSSLDNPSAYLRKAIVRVAQNAHRSSMRSERHVRRSGSPSVSMSDEHPSDLEDLLLLSPRVRAVLFLHVVEDRPFDEVAAVVGCSSAAARKIASRGLAELRRTLEEDDTVKETR